MAAIVFQWRIRTSKTASNVNDFTCRLCRRTEATYRRTRKALRVKVDDSFAPSKTETQDHIIFNPPSSMPNVYHTPLKFLPESDPRRALNTTAATSSPKTSPTSALATIAAARQASQPVAAQLPSVRPIHEKQYHLGQEQIDEIRRLRQEDPRKWTRLRLAEQFNCSAFFIGLCCSAPEMKLEQGKRLEEIKNKWGRRKREAREDRQTRKKLWGQDA